LDDEKSKHGGRLFVWLCKKVLGPESLRSWAEAGETHSKSLTNSREECNEYDLIALPCF
jgi:hypothetical protein